MAPSATYKVIHSNFKNLEMKDHQNIIGKIQMLHVTSTITSYI